MKPHPNIHQHAVRNFAAHLVAAILVLVCLFPACAQAAPVSFSVRGHWPTGYPPTEAFGQVRLAGNLAYVGTAGYPPYGSGATWSTKPRLVVLDVTNPSQPVWVGYCDVAVPIPPDEWILPQDLWVAGRYAYQTHQKGILSIVDISNPAQPLSVGAYTLGQFAGGLRVSGRYAYVAAVDQGLQVLDVNDPAQPVLAGGCATTGRAICLSVEGQTAYVQVCTWDPPYFGLDVIDISNPEAPVPIGALQTVNGYGALDVTDGYTYFCDFDGLRVIDVHNRSLPTVVGTLGSGVVGINRAIKVVGRHAYMFQPDNGFCVVDVGNPTRPVVVGRTPFEYPGIPSFGSVDLGNGYAFAAGTIAPKVIDVRDPAAPRVVGGLMDEFVPRRFLALRVEPGVVFAVEADRLTVMNVQDPANPREVSRYTAVARRNLYDVQVQGGHALLAGSGFWELLDVANPAAPMLLHHKNTVAGTVEWMNTRCRIAGDRGYLHRWRYVPERGINLGQLEIVDLTNPSAPLMLGVCTWTNLAGSHDLAVMNGYVHVVDGENGLTIIDAINPASPRIVSNLKGGGGSAIEVRANHAYIVRSWVRDDESQPYRGRFWVVDVSDPLHPVTVGTCDAPAGVALCGVDLVDRYALVGSFPDPSAPGAAGGFEVIDVTDPAKPTWVGNYRCSVYRDTSSDRAPFQVLGDQVYLNEWGGLTILDMSLPGVLKLNPPVLSANTLTLSWNGGPGIKLQKTISLMSPDWQDVPGSDGVSQITVPADGVAAFFRLVKP